MRQRPQKRSSHRLAVTLMELLLTLAVLVAMAAIVSPSLLRSFDQLRLQKAADQVRSGLAMARLRALTLGQTQVFAYTAGDTGFMIGCLHNEQAAAAGSITSNQSAPLNAVDENVTPGTGAINRALPEGITLLDAQIGEDQRRRSNQEVSAADRAASGKQSLVYFYPDGSGSSARIVLGNKSDRYVMVELRGLTGLSTTSEVLTAAELK